MFSSGLKLDKHTTAMRSLYGWGEICNAYCEYYFPVLMSLISQFTYVLSLLGLVLDLYHRELIIDLPGTLAPQVTFAIIMKGTKVLTLGAGR